MTEAEFDALLNAVGIPEGSKFIRVPAPDPEGGPYALWLAPPEPGRNRLLYYLGAHTPQVGKPDSLGKLDGTTLVSNTALAGVALPHAEFFGFDRVEYQGQTRTVAELRAGAQFQSN